MNPLDLLVGALAIWRTASMLAYERGPFALFRGIRKILGIAHFDDDKPDSDNPPNELARMLLCVWCSSPWFAALWLGLYSLHYGITMTLSYILAFSAVAVILEQRVG